MISTAETPGEFVKETLNQAVDCGATDIHFTPFGQNCTLRFRIDGVLRAEGEIERNFFDRTVSAIKDLAGIEIKQKNKPQDGRIPYVIKGRPVDFRVSVVPALHGESVVLRVLDSASKLRSIDKLGLFPKQLKLFRSFLACPDGLIVVTGPNGAGKTATLYGALRELNNPDKNVVCVEEDVEYELEDVLQIAKNQVDSDFASLLRSVLRHDPDTVMIGEIQGSETAELAVSAAVTGHLVLSALYAQHAAVAIDTLLSLGIKPYALAPALVGVIAQRLVREICPKCKTSFEYGDEVLGQSDFADVLPKGVSPSFSIGLGCEDCFQSGYRGRRGIFEALEAGDAVKKKILSGANAQEIEHCAREEGMETLRQSGFRAVLEGITTVEEVARIVYIE